MPGKPRRASRRADIVKAAETLLRKRGLNGVTTRAIAESVPCSEGAIYVHFEDRLSLVLEVLREALPEMVVPLHALRKKVGTATPEENLLVAVTGLTRFHRRVTPMLCSLFSQPDLLQRFRASLDGGGKGPHRGIATLAAYIEEEQQLGRVDRQVDAAAAGMTLMAASFFEAFTEALLGSPARPEARHLVQMVLGTRRGTK
ncbi:MAG TPA: TetR/AcrR family transcriptional regulator [Acidobacteriaceae bacterium]|jgi:AcrR family transcriptional regulator|nr:TetR/AcrR family transcriptional regulator [Acidobacteriaceae bacterium]